jgi:hypothetical protein
MATVFVAFPWGMASAFRALPIFLLWMVMIVYVSAAFRTPLLFAFFCLFPMRLIGFANALARSVPAGRRRVDEPTVPVLTANLSLEPSVIC